jgi:general L-amino acid transport system substrate-binding protein
MRRSSLLRLASITALAVIAACGQRDEARREDSTLAAVRARGFVACGASQGTVGFGRPDNQGYWRGLDVDTCRAIAAAVFGDREKARFVPLTGQQRLTALQSGEIDVLPRTTTWTLARDANGINFTFPNYYDYVGILVRRSAGVGHVKELGGASFCVQTGSTTEVTFADLDRAYRLNLRPVVFDSVQATRQAFFSGRCDALISDASALASVRATQSSNPEDYVIIPANDEVAALTPSVRHGDDQWFDIVKWSFQALLVAEHLGLTQSNVESMRDSEDPQIRRFLGAEPGNGAALGLRDDWAYQIVLQVGNYGEIFERNVGRDSPLAMERGLNRLQRDGGLMVPLAIN